MHELQKTQTSKPRLEWIVTGLLEPASLAQSVHYHGKGYKLKVLF